MKIYLRLFIIFLFSLPCIRVFNINDTGNSFVRSEIAELLLNYDSALYSKESFINFALYGRSDVHFSFEDFLNSYG